MRLNFMLFVHQKITHYLIAIGNIFIFLPYFFSVKPLLKTLFKPWKNVVTPRPKTGESLSDWFSRLNFNLISSFMGFIMRSAIIGSYLIFQVFIVVFLPVITTLFLLSLPIQFFINIFKTPEPKRKEQHKSLFLQTRLQDGRNLEAVTRWFEWYYFQYINRAPWWHLRNLLSAPPLARDWSFGFTPALDQYGEDITLSKPHYKLLVDRVSEIDAIEQILSKSQEHNCLVVGEEGVGKHTVVEGLARKIYEGKSTPPLNFRRIIKLDMEKIISAGADFTQKEELLKNVLIEAEAAGNIIVFIDNFDRYISSSANSIDLSQIISAYAKSERLQIIGITSLAGFQKNVAFNEEIVVLFQKVDVVEVTPYDALTVLLTSVFDFEKRFGVIIPYESAKEAVDKSGYYITSIPFPEKALQLLDEACVYAQQTLKTKLVTPAIVDTVLSAKTHIPIALDQKTKDKLLNLESLLRARIIQQNEGIEALSSTLRKSMVSHEQRRKPLASLLFLGPTGVGKTETAKAVAEVFFGSESSLLRFDMALYQSKNDIATLIGSPDTGNPGLLSSAIRQKPYGVMLIDEIEKADHDLLNIFLTLLDEGYFADGFGKRVDCKNLIIIATSNAGADFMYELLKNNQKLDKNNLINYLVETKLFLPEFLNRFDGVVVYKPLEKQAVSEIAKKNLLAFAQNFSREHQASINFTPGFINTLVEKGYDVKFGARNLSRVIRDELEDKVAKLVLENKIQKGQTITF